MKCCNFADIRRILREIERDIERVFERERECLREREGGIERER